MDADKIARGGGPENTKYDRNRHAAMRLRPMGMYGDLKIFQYTEPLAVCCKCGGEIVSDHLVIFKRDYHGKCFHLCAR